MNEKLKAEIGKRKKVRGLIQTIGYRLQAGREVVSLLDFSDGGRRWGFEVR